MPRPARTLPLEIVHDHVIARIGTASALIDTGSPLTFRAPDLVAERLNRPIRWLVGTDVIARHPVVIDWSGRRLVVGGPALQGEVLPLVSRAGLFQIAVEGAHGSALAFLDTGAPLSYAPASAVRGRAPVAREKDFYPLFGEFEVAVYELSVRVGRRRIVGRFGVLPEMLALLLEGVGGTGWILGSDFFRNRVIQLDLAQNRAINATVVAGRQRTTRRSRSDVDANDLFAPQATAGEMNVGIEGWRGWRLTDVAGTPRLQSISANDVWDGPCFTADELPTANGTRSTTGIHAYATPGQIQSVLRGSALVYGQVTLHGTVCIHEMGYRAEHARIDRLFLRACGRHGSANVRPTGLLLLDVLALETLGQYCSCESLEPQEWLNYDQLTVLARQLGDRYQCKVVIDAERGRTPSYCCSHTRRQRKLVTRRA